jgi:hypothetical protein
LGIGLAAHGFSVFWSRFVFLGLGRKENPGVHEKDKSEKWGKGSFRIV